MYWPDSFTLCCMHVCTYACIIARPFITPSLIKSKMTTIFQWPSVTCVQWYTMHNKLCKRKLYMYWPDICTLERSCNCACISTYTISTHCISIRPINTYFFYILHNYFCIVYHIYWHLVTKPSLIWPVYRSYSVLKFCRHLGIHRYNTV